MRESINDRIINTYLYLNNWFRHKVFSYKSFGCDEPEVNKMKLSFSDKFSFFDTNKWRIGQPWGKFHPDFTYQYYGDDSITIKDEYLVLTQFYNPKKIENIEIPQSVGLITSIDSFGYGFYKFECKLPKGVGLWPAIWLSCVDSWPPEIDILEGYSNEKSDYNNNLQSNLHYDFGENKKSTGARNHPVFSNDDKIILGCHFTKDFIKIYYNGYLVRQITSDNILNFFRDKKMIIVINNAIREEYKDVNELINQKSEFIIYNVNFWSNE